MVLELNPVKWFAKPLPQLVFAPDGATDVPAATGATGESAGAVEQAMSTAAVMPAVAAKKTWLQQAGDALRKALHIGVEVAVVAEPYVDMAVPRVGELYNGTLGLFVQSEASFGAAPGKGAVKLAAAVPAITANLQAWAADNGFEVVESEVPKWASVIADSLNLLPVVKKDA